MLYIFLYVAYMQTAHVQHTLGFKQYTEIKTPVLRCIFGKYTVG